MHGYRLLCRQFKRIWQPVCFSFDLLRNKPGSVHFDGVARIGKGQPRPPGKVMHRGGAMAGKITIAEVEELVEAGQLNPDHIHVPGIYVNRIFKGEKYEKRIEQRTVIKK